MTAAVVTPPEQRQALEEDQVSTMAFYRLRGLAEHLSMAFRQAHTAMGIREDFTKEELDRFDAFLNMILPDLIGNGTGDAFHLTQLALALEEPGHRFADLLHQLSDAHGMWTAESTPA